MNKTWVIIGVVDIDYEPDTIILAVVNGSEDYAEEVTDEYEKKNYDCVWFEEVRDVRVQENGRIV